MRLQKLLLLTPAALFACGSSNNTGTTGGGQTTTSSTSSTHMNVCVQTTDKGNSIGVGKYCTPNGGQCMGLGAGLCTADLGQDEWFCLKIGCQTDTDCAENATCVMQMGGAGCVPNKCLEGSDAGLSDAPSDGG